jgi:flavorubredoxin
LTITSVSIIFPSAFSLVEHLQEHIFQKGKSRTLTRNLPRLSQKGLYRMARTTFDQDIFVAAPPTITRERLAKLMTTLTEMHPLVVWARYVQTTTSPDGTPVDHYLVRDHMKLGPFQSPSPTK